jgi:two-component system sensor histidine kinase PhoQ
LESAAPFRQELAQFRRQLWLPLLIAGALLLLAQPLLLRWGLRPLRRMATDIAAVESGLAQRLPDGQPAELQALARNLNGLLDHESQLRARYIQRLDDLAHSLKTPLAVMAGALREEGDQKTALSEQLAAMDEIVKYQLRRATGGGASVAGERLNIDELLQKLQNTLDKVYSDKNVIAQWFIEPGLAVRGDRRDFLELFGNLIDNAYKYCEQRLSISARRLKDGTGFELIVEDDGPGIKPDSREQILRRGQRLDTTVAGQGIGLAVVVDILEAYGYRLEVGDSAKLGGARFSLSCR